MPIKPIFLRTLGTAQVDIGQVQVRPNAVRRFAALLYLSAEAGRRVPRRCLIDLLFPDQTERNGLHSLRELVYQLKAAEVGLEADQEGIELPATAVRADYAELIASERLTIDQIRAAQGGFLPGYVPHGSEAFKEWFEPFRARVVFGLSRVLLRDQARARDVANLEVAEAAARACLAVSPLNELAVKALAETMVLGGAKTDALRLLDDYGLEVGTRSPQLKLSAGSLRRRIRERTVEHFRPAGELLFTGRDPQMLELHRNLSVSRGGASRTVVIVGDPGIGKTRLLNEFASLAQFEEATVHRLTAHANSLQRPMGVVIDLAAGLLQLPGALGTSPESMEALQRLTAGITTQAACQREDSCDAMSRAITQALGDLLSAIAAEVHLVVLLDDAHWADRLSLRLLANLVGNGTDRVLLVAATRTRKGADELIVDGNAAVVQLPALDFQSAIHVSRRALRGTPAEDDDKLHSWMASVAQGNPLFLESVLTHFRETGEQFTVPSGLHDLLAQRLSSLDASSTAVLQTCVLLGGLSTDTRLSRCLEIPFIELVSSINELERLRLVASTAAGVQPAHPLIAEVLQARSAGAVLRLIHRRIGAILEEEPGRLESSMLLWESAEHLAAAGEDRRALENYRKCADHAQRIGRPAEAAAVLLRGAQLDLSDDLLVEVLTCAVRAAQQAGEFDDVLEGTTAIRRINAKAITADVELAELTAMSIIYDASADFSDRVLSCISAAHTDPTHRVRVALAGVKYADTYSVPQLARRVVQAISDRDLSFVDESVRLEFRMISRAALGDLDAVIPYAKQLHLVAGSLPAAPAVGAMLNVGQAYWRAGLTAESLLAFERAYELAVRCCSLRRQMTASMQLALISSDEWNFDSAKMWRARALELRKSTVREFGEFEFALFDIDFALREKDLCRAREVLAVADQKRVFSSPMRLRWRRCVDARTRQLLGEQPLSPSELDVILSDWDDPSCISGIKEAEIGVISAALIEQNRQDEARERLTSFFSWRSRYSRSRIPLQLQQTIADCRLQDVMADNLTFL